MNAYPLRERFSAVRFATVAVLCFSIGQPLSLVSNPKGAKVRQGSIRMERGANSLRVVQRSGRGVIDWNSFSIRHGQTTRFVQPNARSATLNRVTGGTVSRIDGNLRANGNVFLINPNGVLVGRTGVIDVAGFTASTLDISDGDFMTGGDLRFRGDSQAAVVNLGSISAFDGDIFLVGSTVENSGSIRAARGTVGLAAGNDVLIKESGTERVFVRGASGGKKEEGVVNKGSIHANIAELKSYGGNLYGMAVKNEGRVAATGVTREGGQIFLRAGGKASRSRVQSTGTLVAKKEEGSAGGRVTVDSGSEGVTEVGGTIDASGRDSGGEVVLLGRNVTVQESSLILADGGSAGGSIYIGGGIRGEDVRFMNATDVSVGEGAVISANAIGNGDGGEIIVFAENRVDFLGRISATGGAEGGDGGFAEISGKNEVLIPDLSSRVFLGAVNGKGGSLLFDPTDIVIFSGTGTGPGTGFPTGLNAIADGDIVSFLNAGNSLTIETSGTGTDAGDISVNSDVNITWAASSDLSFMADRDFRMTSGAVIESQGIGSVSVTANRSIALGIPVEGELLGGGIKTNTGDITIKANEAGTTSGTFVGLDVTGDTIETADGTITLLGHGGNQDPVSTDSNFGVSLFNTQVLATGTGIISIEGTGGNASTGNGAGVSISATGLRSHDGNLSVTGVGGTTSSNVASGIQSQSAFETTGSGDILLTGTGGSNNGYGLELYGNVQATGTGSIELKGESKATGLQGIITGFSTTLISTADAASSILIEANSVDFTMGGFQSPGDLKIRPLDPGSAIHIGAGAVDAGLQLSQTEINNFADGFASISIGEEDFGFGDVTVTAVTFTDPTTIAAPYPGSRIFVNGQITGLDNASIAIDGAGPDSGNPVAQTTYLNAGIVTSGNQIRISDDVLLRGDATLDTTMGGSTPGGADVIIEGTVDSETTAKTLTLDAGTDGDIDLQGMVGSTAAVGNLDFDSRNISIGHSVVSSGSVAIDATQSAKILSGVDLNADGSITVNANQGTMISGDFDGIEVAGSISSTNGQVLLVGTGGGDPGNRGVWIHSGSGVDAYGDVFIKGNVQAVDETGVLVQTQIQSNSGSVEVATDSGDVEIAGLLNGAGNLLLTGSSTADTDFFVSVVPNLTNFTVDGGGGANSVDFSGSSGGGLYLNADQFSNVGSIIGTSSNFDSFQGSSTVGATYDVTGANAFTYDDLNGEVISFTAFEDIFGSDFDDLFRINLGTGNTFGGSISGRGGADGFSFTSGSVNFLAGGFQGSTEEDVIDFSGVSVPVSVDLDLMSLSYGSDQAFFESIERIIGGSSEDQISATIGDDLIQISGDGAGSISYEDIQVSAFPTELDGPSSPANVITYPQMNTVFFESFSYVDGSEGEDTFSVGLPIEAAFNGTLDGGTGDDIFALQPGGSVAEIIGGSDFDSLDFSAFPNSVEVNLEEGSATQVDSFSGVEGLVGGMSVDQIIGSQNDDEITITSDTGGLFSITVDKGEGGSSVSEFEFSDFEQIAGVGGNDTFFLSTSPGPLLNGVLQGGAGNDRFVIAPGGGVSGIDGGSEFDTLDFSGFATPVTVDFRTGTATQVGSIAGIESLLGGASTDTLIGTENADIFRIQSDNSGTLNSGSFSGFETLLGAGGNDQFQFFNQAIVGSVAGGQGTDLLRIDDRGLGGAQTYTIGQNSIVRNPTYNFSGLETLTLLLGDGDNTVVTRGNGLTQIIDAGGGEDFLDMGQDVFLGGNPIQLGSSRIFASNFEGPIAPATENNSGGVILSQLIQQVPTPDSSGGDPVDPFASTPVSPATMGAFSASLAAAVAGQSAASQLDAAANPLQTPASLDGTFTPPPESIIALLKENLAPDVWAELADAIDFEGSTILLMVDGPYMINLTEGTPAEIAALLLENLSVAGSVELLQALEMTIAIPLVSSDGPVGIVTVQVPIPQEVLDMLAELLGEESFAELNSALDG